MASGKKEHSGIKRGSKSGGAAKMSPSDAYRLQHDEEYLSHTSGIPDYIRRDMTIEQMEEAIVAHVRETGKGITVGGSYFSPEEIDGRLPAPKDSRFNGLVGAINTTNISKLPEPPVINGYDREGKTYRQLEQHVINITSRYSTRELREFVNSELGGSTWGGRPGYITAITLMLNNRLTDRGRGGSLKRNTLGEVSSRAKAAAEIMHSNVGVRSTVEKRVAAIKAKYRIK